jgi:hypothetical protein
MQIKLFLKEQNKELNFDKNVKDLIQLKKEISLLTGLSEQAMILSFVDFDLEKIQIKDQYDFDYMLDQEPKPVVVEVDSLSNKERNIEERSSSDSDSKAQSPVEVLKENTDQIISNGKDSSFFKKQKNDIKTIKQFFLNGNRVTIPHEDQILTIQQPVILNKAQLPFDENASQKLENKELGLGNSSVGYHNNALIIEKPHKIEESLNRVQATTLQIDSIKQNIEDALHNNLVLRDLKSRIELLTDIVDQGMSGLKDDILNMSISKIDQTLSNNNDVNKLHMTVHKGVSCDLCNVHPISGKRFKCLVCPNYDICSSCEDKNIHKHPKMVFYDRVDIKLAEEMASLYRVKSNLMGLNEYEIKIRILKNIAGDKYEESFYQSFVQARRVKSIADFIDEVIKIFE